MESLAGPDFVAPIDCLCSCCGGISFGGDAYSSKDASPQPGFDEYVANRESDLFCARGSVDRQMQAFAVSFGVPCEGRDIRDLSDSSDFDRNFSAWYCAYFAVHETGDREKWVSDDAADSIGVCYGLCLVGVSDKTDSTDFLFEMDGRRLKVEFRKFFRCEMH